MLHGVHFLEPETIMCFGIGMTKTKEQI